MLFNGISRYFAAFYELLLLCLFFAWAFSLCCFFFRVVQLMVEHQVILRKCSADINIFVQIDNCIRICNGTIAFRICMTCCRWKPTVWRENFFPPKKHPKTAFFGGHDSGVSWLREELYAELLGLGQLLGCPWKVWGITVQTSYWEGLWHQNCGYTSPILFFGGGKRNQWKTELFCKSLCTWKFSTGNFLYRYGIFWLQKKSIGLVYPQFWCQRPSQ